MKRFSSYCLQNQCGTVIFQQATFQHINSLNKNKTDIYKYSKQFGTILGKKIYSLIHHEILLPPSDEQIYEKTMFHNSQKAVISADFTCV